MGARSLHQMRLDVEPTRSKYFIIQEPGQQKKGLSMALRPNSSILYLAIRNRPTSGWLSKERR